MKGGCGAPLRGKPRSSRATKSYGSVFDSDLIDAGTDLSKIGLKHFDAADTIYGDWGCTAFDIDAQKPVGKFCADVGKVCVCLMSEIKGYNPDFPKWVEKHDWCVTTIPNFDGEAYIIHFSYPDPFFDGTHDVAYVLALGSHNIICWQTEA